MQNKICVVRTGTPYYVGGAGASARGDMDTDPLVRYLCDSGRDVAFFGPIRNVEEAHPRLHVIGCESPRAPSGQSQFIDEKTFRDHFEPCVHELDSWGEGRLVFLDVCGPPPSWSWPYNSNCAGVHDWCVKYSLPGLYAIAALNGPRYCVITDPKVYKRDLEMATIWPAVTPKAVLSQESRQFPRRMQDHDYIVHCAYAGCEYWLTRGMKPRPWTATNKRRDCVICANAHLTERRLPKDRDGLWEEIFAACPGVGTAICGAGWEHHPRWQSNPGWFVGVLDTFADVMDFISTGYMGPMVPQWPGFNSTKIRLYALAGTCPRPFGDGEHPMTYDRDGRVLPLDHPARWDKYRGHYDCIETIQLVLERTEPDFNVLDKLLDEPVCRYPDKTWLSTYGGYEKL